MVLWHYRGTIQALIVVAIFIWALRKGAAPEKATASVLAMMTIAVWVYRLLHMNRGEIGVVRGFSGLEPGYLAIDLLGFVALAAVALPANRIYPTWMAGFQLTAVATHFATASAAETLPRSYALLNMAPFYCVMAACVAGLIAHRRRERRIGPYRSWRTGFASSPEKTRRWPPGV